MNGRGGAVLRRDDVSSVTHVTDRARDWRPILEGPDAQAARAVAREIGSRLRDPETLARATEAAPAQSAVPEYAVWRPAGLAQGHPGLAVLFAALDACFPSAYWKDAGRVHLGHAVDALRRDHDVATGLTSGLAGLGFAAEFADRDVHARLLATLDGLIRRRTEPVLNRIAARRSGVAEYDVDVVSGLSGIGAYFLTREDEEALRPILETLVPLLARDSAVPAWHAPADLLPDDDRSTFPSGRLNCGLAHGVPGPIALLALASAAGAGGVDEAIRQATSWLVEHAVEDEWGINWPAFVRMGSAAPEPPTRAAWCYGAPGVARALWLAGEAMDDSALRELAVAALVAVHRRPQAERRIDAPTFCHGRAGLLQVTLRLAHDSGSSTLRAAATELARELVAEFRPGDSIFGYRDLDVAGQPVDQAGLLYGAAGTALVLLAAATPVEPRWDRMFLLS
jgi:lantibiotic modifying enzyme